MRRVHAEHVEADALRLDGLVEQPIALRLRQRRRNRVRREPLQLEHQCPPNILNSFTYRIVEPIDDALLERDDRVVGDRDVLGAHLRAAVRDVAVPDAVLVFQRLEPVLGVERVHLERRGVDEEARPDELGVQRVIAQDVADVLAQEALDALAELLHAIDVGLRHAPRAVRRVRRPRLERLDRLLDLVVPRHVGDEIPDQRERLHRLERDRLVERELVETRHAHQPRVPVHLRRARPALAGLAVPADGQIVGLRSLNGVDGVEDDHPGDDVGGVVLELARRLASPRQILNVACAMRVLGAAALARPALRWLLIPRSARPKVGPTCSLRSTCFSSAGISGIGTRRTSIEPSAACRTTMLILPNSGALSG